MTGPVWFTTGENEDLQITTRCGLSFNSLLGGGRHAVTSSEIP